MRSPTPLAAGLKVSHVTLLRLVKGVTDKFGERFWAVRCDCGRTAHIRAYNIRRRIRAKALLTCGHHCRFVKLGRENCAWQGLTTREWARKLGISYVALFNRRKRLSLEEAVMLGGSVKHLSPMHAHAAIRYGLNALEAVLKVTTDPSQREQLVRVIKRIKELGKTT